MAYKYAARGVRGQSVSCPQHSRYIQHHEAPGECGGLGVTSGLIFNISVLFAVRHPGPVLRVRVSPAHAHRGRPRPVPRPRAPGPRESPPRQAALPQG